MKFLDDLGNQFTSYYDTIVELFPRLLIGVVSVTILAFVLSFLRKKIIGLLRKKADDKLLVNFANNIFTIVNYILIALFFLSVIGQGKVASTILGAAGISAFVIGFALKDIGENFLAGLVMAFDRPFRLGDTIKTGDVEGIIRQMNLRDTHIKTFDGKDVYVPNGQIIKMPLYNYTIDGFIRGSFTVGVDYDTDLQKARDLILTAINKVPGVLQEDKLARTHVKNLNTSTVDIEVHYWVNTFDKNHSGLEIKSKAQSAVITALTESSIGMPADIVELKSYDDSMNFNQNISQRKNQNQV